MLDEDSFVELGTVHPVLSATFMAAFMAWKTMHPDLNMRVTEGMRTAARQLWLVKRGKSKRLDSLHLTGLAIDVAILNRDRSKALWDIPLYEEFANHMAVAFRRYQKLGAEGCHVMWGGRWRLLVDAVHFELVGFDGVSIIPHIEEMLKTP